jgi:hypothetical protein
MAEFSSFLASVIKQCEAAKAVGVKTSTFFMYCNPIIEYIHACIYSMIGAKAELQANSRKPGKGVKI